MTELRRMKLNGLQRASGFVLASPITNLRYNDSFYKLSDTESIEIIPVISNPSVRSGVGL